MNKTQLYYVLIVNGGTEILREGPFSTATDRDNKAKQIYKDGTVWDESFNLFWADIDSDGGLFVGSFTGDDLE